MISYLTLPEAASAAHKTRHNEAGFTLLEIMVAMVVLTMIISTAFGALRLAERSWEAGLEHAGETERLRTVSAVLQRSFSQILALSWSENTKTHIAFSGDQKQLRFIAPAPQHHGATGLFEYTLVVAPHAGSNRLMLYYRLHDPDHIGFAADGSDRQQVLLVDELKTASFAYYGSPVTGDPAQWHAQWNTDAEAFPRLVHMRIVSPPEQGQWPDLFLALHTELSK